MIVMYAALIVVTLGATALGLETLFKEKGGIGHIATTLETIRIRTANPTMPVHLIEAEARKSNRGAMGLMKTLSGGSLESDAKARKDLEAPESALETEVVAVVHATGTEDLTALDRINAMNIPEEMKQQILRNYEMTGVLPEITVRAKPKPQRQPASDEF